MYNRSKIKQEFWTAFGQYMAPVLNADGEKINWINYKTGVKHIFIRANADERGATIGIEIRHPDYSRNLEYFNRLLLYKPVLHEQMGEPWQWEATQHDSSAQVSRIYLQQTNLNLYQQSDWPGIISFLKPRLISLDSFWSQVKDLVE